MLERDGTTGMTLENDLVGFARVCRASKGRTA